MKRLAQILYKAVPAALLVFALILPLSAEGIFPDQSVDGGADYRDRLFFLGESTTAHLRARGVLTGGTATDRVFAPRSGTMMLSRRILTERVTEPLTGAEMTISEAVALRRPEILVLSFGLNGILGFLNRKTDYTEPYRALIRAVKQASPGTVVILQTVYPVAREPGGWNFNRSPAEINRAVETLNGWLPEIAAAEGAFVVDTAAVLRDGDGFLRADFSADGIHLTREGYEAVLFCLQTHMVGVGS